MAKWLSYFDAEHWETVASRWRPRRLWPELTRQTSLESNSCHDIPDMERVLRMDMGAPKLRSPRLGDGICEAQRLEGAAVSTEQSQDVMTML